MILVILFMLTLMIMFITVIIGTMTNKWPPFHIPFINVLVFELLLIAIFGGGLIIYSMIGGFLR